MSIEAQAPPFTRWTVVPPTAAASAPVAAWHTAPAPAAHTAWSPLSSRPAAPAMASEAVEEEVPPAACLTGEELASACAAAAQLAVEQERTAVATLERQARTATFDRLAEALTAAAGGYEDCLDRIADSAAMLLDALLEAGGLAGRLPADGVRAGLRATLAETLRAPVLRIEVAPAYLHAAGDVIREARAAATLPAKVELGAASAPGTAMRIEWADGWAETDRLRAAELLRARLAEGLAGLRDPDVQDDGGDAARSER